MTDQGETMTAIPDQLELRRFDSALDHHQAVENAHDIDAILETFRPDAEIVYNDLRFSDDASIRLAHESLGFDGAGALSGLENIEDQRIHAGDTIVVEGHLAGRHTASLLDFPPTGNDVNMAYVAIYEFDPTGLVVSERIVMHTAQLLIADVEAP